MSPLNRKQMLLFCLEWAHDRGIICLNEDYQSCQTAMRWACQTCSEKWNLSLKQLQTSIPICLGCPPYRFVGVLRFSESPVPGQATVNLVSPKKGSQLVPLTILNCHCEGCGKVLPKLKDAGGPPTSLCLDCSELNANKKILLQCQTHASSKHGRCISHVFVSDQFPMEWLCLTCRSLWKDSWQSVRNGKWCPSCMSAHRFPKKTALSILITSKKI
jgi:hypothetical protein